MLPAGVKAGASTVRCAVWSGSKSRETLAALPRAQRRLAEILTQAEPPVPVKRLLEQAGCSAGPLRALASKGLVRIVRGPDDAEDASLLLGEGPAAPGFTLTDAQEKAYNRISAAFDAKTFRVLTLFGVTGSGKTEVYIRAIQHAISAGKQALLLVPEIALTTQTLSRLTARLTHLVALHSGLSDAQRAAAWRLIASGKARVVVGTRSAVFAPCPDLGLIVIDEEQEGSYKNIQSPRFHSRDVAIKRAQLLDIPIVLGSATPSLETWLNAHRQPHFELLRLPHRVRGLPMPSVHLVDMRLEQRARRGIHLLSRQMEQELAETLERHEQAVLLLNRRGYASFIFCPSCGRRVVCPRCKVNMVFHAKAGQARCHYCHSHFVVPQECSAPGCRHKLVQFGMGTQRVEEEIRRKFPHARLARVDSDTMTRPAEFATLLAAFEAGRIDILVGTQMVAKGLDFPFVSFVGVVSADTSLALPDFRATERTFQLVTQVAGRAGRADVPGSVVVQTYAADLVAVRAAIKHDFERFARTELAARKKMRFPPYWRLTRILLADRRPDRLRSAAERLASALRELLGDLPDPADIIGPQPSPINRIRDKYRYDILIRAATARSMQALLDRVRLKNLLRVRVQQVSVDVDPVTLV